MLNEQAKAEDAKKVAKREYMHAYWLKNKQRLSQRNKQYHEENRERIREVGRLHYEKNRVRLNAQCREWYRELKEKVFALYGDKCAKCGFSDKRALQLDHVKDDGAIRRRGPNGNRSSYQQQEYQNAVSRHQPDVYQILCANCNSIKRDETKYKFRKLRSAEKVKAAAA